MNQIDDPIEDTKPIRQEFYDHWEESFGHMVNIERGPLSSDMCNQASSEVPNRHGIAMEWAVGMAMQDVMVSRSIAFISLFNDCLTLSRPDGHLFGVAQRLPREPSSEFDDVRACGWSYLDNNRVVRVLLPEFTYYVSKPIRLLVDSSRDMFLRMDSTPRIEDRFRFEVGDADLFRVRNY